MSGNTLSTYTTTTLNLSAGPFPFTIEQSGTIVTNSLAAVTNYAYPVYGRPVLTNMGVIDDTLSSGLGIRFLANSTVSATVVNDGTIIGHQAIDISGGAGTVLNYGQIIGSLASPIGIDLQYGGTVYNAALATITATAMAVKITFAGTVTNDGDIIANSTTGTAILFASGGSMLTNYGTITGRTGVSTTGAGTVINDGDIVAGVSTSTTANVGILLASGYVSNAAGAHITALNGPAIKVTGSDGTVTSYNTILDANGTVINAGTITAGVISTHDYGSAIELFAGGYVHNEAGGSISAFQGKAIYINPRVGGSYSRTGPALDATVVNDGSITSAGGWGVYIGNGGTVTNDAGAFIYGGGFGVLINNPGTIINAGTIISNKYNFGIDLNFGGIVNNAAGGFIYGGYHGVTAGDYAVATVVNNGIILGGYEQADGSRGGSAIALLGDGYVRNGPGATIYGYHEAIYMETGHFTGGIGTVINAGDIESNNNAVLITSPGSVTNAASGTIAGGANGIVIEGNGTVVNAGTIGFAGTVLPETPPVFPAFVNHRKDFTIASTSRPAIIFESSRANRLVVDPGAVFIGLVEANPAASNTMELASGSSAGTLTGIGSQFTGFGTIQIDTGASWTLAGSMAGFNDDSISGFSGLDTIDITGFTATPGIITLTGAGVLTAGGVALTFTGAEAEAGTLFTITSDGNGGTEITDNVMCFLEGTRIATPVGEVPVEALRIGDPILTADGGIVPVRWIGIHSAATRFADPLRVMPIRIKAGALGENLPRRDLLVSPDHAMYLGGILVQAGAMVNGSSITREGGMPERFVYYHVETTSHALILAEGAATETFVDNADRLGFDNWSEHQALYGGGAAILEMDYPRAKSARQIPAQLRGHLAARAAAFGGMALSA